MFHSTLPPFAQVIDSEAVRLLIDEGEQSITQKNKLSWVDPTLKDRSLNTLSIVFASLGHSAQTASAFESCRGHVVTDYNQDHVRVG